MTNNEIDLEESKNVYILLRVGQERVATPILSIREILEPIAVSYVSNTIPFFKGIINVRGEVIGLIDLRMKFKQDASRPGLFVIVDDPNGPIAYIVDEVLRVEEILAEAIKTDIKIQHGGDHEYFKGVVKSGAEIVSVIDFFKLYDIESNIEFGKLRGAAA